MSGFDEGWFVGVLRGHGRVLVRWGVLGIVATAGYSVASGERRAAPYQAPAAQATQCDDPHQQLPCYCTSHGFADKVATNSNIIAPCYRSSLQVASSSLLGFFSVWSWTASNWPVNARREPDYAANLGDRADHATVWETWKTSADVFLPDGRRPPGLDSEQRLLPTRCRAVDLKAAKARYPGWEKVPSELPPRYLPVYQINSATDVVVDRNAQPLRVEIVMNRAAFNYIY